MEVSTSKLRGLVARHLGLPTKEVTLSSTPRKIDRQLEPVWVIKTYQVVVDYIDHDGSEMQYVIFEVMEIDYSGEREWVVERVN